MYPHERSLVKKWSGKPFALLGVNSDTDRESLKETLREEEITWRSFWDSDTSGPIASAWEIQGWPSVFLIDHKGIIRARSVGAPDANFEVLMADLIAEAEKEGK